MKATMYNPFRDECILAGWTLCFSAVILFLVSLIRPVLHDIKFFSLSFIVLLIGLSCFICAGAQRSYYRVTSDGICVYQRSGTMLASIPWNHVKACSIIPRTRRACFSHYLVIVLDSTAMIGPHLAMGYTDRMPERIAKRYWFHRATEKLARGQISNTQFFHQGVFIIASDEMRCGQWKAMWMDVVSENQ